MGQKRNDIHNVKYIRKQNQNNVEGANKSISKDSGDHREAVEPEITD